MGGGEEELTEILRHGSWNGVVNELKGQSSCRLGLFSMLCFLNTGGTGRLFCCYNTAPASVIRSNKHFRQEH